MSPINNLLSDSSLQVATAKLTAHSDVLHTHPIVLFGCGNLGKKIGKFIRSTEMDLVAFSDNNPKNWGNSILDTPILSPEAAAQLHAENAVFVVCIWSPNHSYKQTKEQLERLGIQNIIHTAVLFQLFPEALLPHYHFETPSYFVQNRDLIAEAYHLFADETSKEQFAAHVDCRINLNFEGLPTADIDNQYFPNDIVQLSTNETFVDAGAFTGDTLEEFSKRTNGKWNNYFALEPDPANLHNLETKIETLAAQPVTVLPVAVGANNEILHFNATGGGGAGISETGTLEVNCVKLDDLLKDTEVTYLKFDIEGAEMDALIGADYLISTYKPKLAVCIYHLPNDLWTLPLYLKAHYPFYNFFARTHQYDGLDFVLYAIPSL